MVDSPSPNRAMPKKQQNLSLDSLPTDLLLKIFGKVAFYSIEDISNIKITCKEFLRLAEQDYVYHNSSLDKFSLEPLQWINREKPFRHYVEVSCPNEDASLQARKVFEWKLSPEERFNKERQAYILKRCKESSNTEIPYREGMLEYFRETSSSNAISLAFENFKTAALNGHDDAMYMYSMLLMCAENKEQRTLGFDQFCSLDASGKLKLCRNRVKTMIISMWVRREVVPKHNLSFCYSSRCKLLKLLLQRSPWIFHEDFKDYGIECENCKADVELKILSRMLLS